MAQDRSFLVQLALLLLDFAADVRQTLADPLRRAALGRDLGGVFAAPRAAQRALPPGTALLQRYVQQLDDDADPQQVLQALRGEFDALRAMLRSFAPDTPAPRDLASTLDEVYALALEMLATDFVRRKHPKLYFVMQFVGFATDAASQLGEGETTLTRSLSAVLGLLSLIFFGPEGPVWDWTSEADARRTSPPLLRVPALLLTVLRLSGGLLKDWADQEWLDLLLGWDRVPGQQGVNDFADGVSDRLLTVRFFEPTPLETADPDTRLTGAITLGLVPRHHGGPGVFLGLRGHLDLKRELTDRLHLRLRLPQAPQGYVFGGGAHWIESAAPGPGDLPLAVELSLDPPTGSQHLWSWPDSGRNRLSLGRLVLSAGLDAQGPHFDLSMHDCLLALDAGAVDGFLGSLLPDKSTAVHFSVGTAYSAEQGLHATGNLVDLAQGADSGNAPRGGPARRGAPTGAVDFQPPLPALGSSSTGSRYEARIGLGQSLGPVTLHEVSLGLTPLTDSEAPGLQLAAAVAFSARIGPLTAVVDRLGLAVPVTLPRDGSQANLHFVNASLDVLPPLAVGIAIDAKAVKGGGFIRYDPVQKQYAGVLELEISRLVSVKALCLVSTRLPDGSKGYSLLVIITAEGFQPIRLPMGFALAGIGGLLALHRTFSEDVLREGLRDKTLDRILFPVDPVNNAPALLATLQRAFPAQRGSWMFGPMLRITWGVPTLVTMDLALIVEWGVRDRLLVLGRIVALLPEPEHPLLRLRMDALGVFDFDQGSAAIDAVLVDSQLLEPLRADRRHGAARALEVAAQLRAGGGRVPPRLHATGGFSQAAAPGAGPQHQRQPQRGVRGLFRHHLQQRAVRRRGACEAHRRQVPGQGRRQLRRAGAAEPIPLPGRVPRRHADQLPGPQPAEGDGGRRAGRPAAAERARQGQLRDPVVGHLGEFQRHAGGRRPPRAAAGGERDAAAGDRAVATRATGTASCPPARPAWWCCASGRPPRAWWPRTRWPRCVCVRPWCR